MQGISKSEIPCILNSCLFFLLRCLFLGEFCLFQLGIGSFGFLQPAGIKAFPASICRNFAGSAQTVGGIPLYLQENIDRFGFFL